MNRSCVLRRIFPGLALLALAVPVSADQDVPFKGVADAVVVAAEPADDGLHLTLSATGEATQLGEFTREESLVVHADGSFVGSVTFVAANGDRLNADISGGFISATTAAGTYTITGGTGRFADASGTASWAGVTSDGIHVAVTFSGTIEF
jgi:hypothetical protein